MSSADPWEFSAPLTVCIDIKNPHAYLAKDRIYQLEDELGLQAVWLPYLVPALRAPTQPQPEDDRGTRHRRYRARYEERDIQRYAGVRGLVIRDIYRQTDSSVAAAALLWIRSGPVSVRRSVIDTLFAGYWERRLEIESVAEVTRVLGDAGADLSGWEAYYEGAGRIELQQSQAALAGAGIFNVPALVVGDVDGTADVFFGRAHLPMVRWLLTDRQGPPPI